MKSIKQIIAENKSKPEKVRRIHYKGYTEEVSKRIWFEIAKSFIPGIYVDEHIKYLWPNLIHYIQGSSLCEFDISKCLCFMGRTGSGKSVTMKIVQQFIEIDEIKFIRNGKIVPFKFHIFSSRQMHDDYCTGGFEALEKYVTYSCICIDDLGSEPSEGLYYGSRLNVLTEVIEQRYNKGLTTHFTTNLNEDLIREKYDDRVLSRMTETCNFLVINGRDYRMSQPINT